MRAFLILGALLPALAAAQVVGVAVDGDVALIDGVASVPPKPGTDSAVFFDFSGGKVKRLGEVAAPNSYLGPPSAIAVSEDKTLALVVSAFELDAKDPTRLAPDDRLSVIDLTASPPRVVQTVSLGVSPSSVKINPAGTLALVMSNPGDSVTELSIQDGRVQILKKLSLGKGMGPLAAAFGPDGRSVAITLADRQEVGVYGVKEDRLQLPALRDLTAGVTPFTVSYCGATGLAVVNNFGSQSGDANTVSLLDMRAKPPRVIDTVTVGPSPEDVACSPDGRYAVATVQNMSNRPKTDPFYSAHSLLVLLRIQGRHLRRVAAAPMGAWAEGTGFLGDSRTVFAQSIVERSLQRFRIQGNTLKPLGAPIRFPNGAPVSYGIAGR